MDQSHLIALGLWLALLGVPLAVAIVLWTRRKRMAAVVTLALGWSLVAAIAAMLIWKGHATRERYLRHEQRQSSGHDPRSYCVTHPVYDFAGTRYFQVHDQRH